MTVSSESRVAGPYAGDDAQVAFTFSFKVVVTTDVVVIHTDSSNVETTKVITTDYTVALNADQDANPGGTVTMIVAPATGAKLTLTSDLPETQGTALPTAGQYSAKILEAALDRLTILHQEVLDLAERSLHLPISETAVDTTLPAIADRKGLLLGFNSTTGKPESSLAASVVSAYMATVLDDLTASDARTTLGLGTADSPTFQGLILDGTTTEAFLVRKDADGGDIFVVDTTNGVVALGGVTPVTGVRFLLPQENDAVTPTLAFGDGDTGFYEDSDDSLNVALAGARKYVFNLSAISNRGSSNGFSLRQESPSSTNPIYTFEGDDDTGVGRAAAGQLSLIANSKEGMRIVESGGVTSIDINQGTNDAPFFDFQATADADATSAISTLTTSGATTHHIQVEINGVTAWIAASTTDPT